MSLLVTHSFGDMSKIENISELERFYLEKDDGDDEHFGISLTDENGWCLGIQRNNSLIWENLEAKENKPRHLKNVSREKVIELWIKLFHGKIDEINLETWLDGYF